MRFFTTEGPVRAEDHYCLAPLRRWDLAEVLGLIEQKKYFLLHAPRQTGKTTCLLALMEYLNRENRYRALYVNIESAQAAREDVTLGMTAVVNSIANSARWRLQDADAEGLAREVLQQGMLTGLESYLTQWCARSSQPIVLLLDEVDALIGDTLISLLRQLRAGYVQRPQHFPHTVVLCGVRDLRDYRIHSSAQRAVITGGSAFNIKAKSLRLGDFDQTEVMTLLGEHSAETGQAFTAQALARVWELTQGQPWLVNALAYEACFDMPAGRDRARPIDIELIDQAKAQGVEHFVFTSVLGTDRGYEDSPVFKAKREVEKVLSNSGLNYTILRPSAFASSLLPLAERFKETGFYLLIGDPKNRSSVVSTDDLATIAIASTQVEGARDRILPVGGPEVITRERIYQIFSQVFNREPIVINPPLMLFDGLRNAVGFLNPDLQRSLGTLRVLLGNEFFCTPEEIAELETLFDIKMESLEQFIRRYFGA